VQANALAKSFFVGSKIEDTSDDPEFYMRTTIVDVGYGAAQDGLFTSTYAQPISRIKWQITEDLLIARITYERVQDSDGKGAGPASSDGVIAAVYPIEGHFDIRRDYNPATGEESNVIVENTSDRPWNQREYFRVNWGKNLATDAYDFDTLSLVGLYGGISYEPLEYYISDPNDPDAPKFDADTGYFDVTNKAFAKPGLVDLSSFGWDVKTFPACYLDADVAGGQAPAANCNPVELTLRQSFKKVEKSDYTPKNYDGYRFQAYGGFTEDRKGYARDYGMVDQKWSRFLSQYNIWERTHYYTDSAGMNGAVKCFVPLDACTDGSCVGTPYGADPNRDDDHDGTADECVAAGKGSQCDTYNQKCTLPFQSRKEKPIVWYYTSGSNQEFFEGTEWAAHEWDVAMRSAVQTAKYAECKRVNGDNCDQYPVLRSQQDSNWDLVQLAKEVDDCRHKVPGPDGQPVYGGTNCDSLADTIGAQRKVEPEVIALAKLPEMLVLCHSPVEANDPEACAPTDKRLPAGTTAAMCADAFKNKNQDTIDICNRALSVRMGDLRYNQVNGIVEPQTPSPWGIMVDAQDPLSGEKVAASINVWTHVNDLFSQGVVDMSRYINGELKTEDITDGKYIKDWASAAEASGKHGIGQYSKDDVRARISSVAGKGFDPKAQADGMGAAGQAAVQPQIHDQLKQIGDLVKNIRSEISAPSSNAPMYAQRLNALAGTDVEALLMNKYMQEYSGVSGMPMTGSIMDIGSPLRGANRTLQRQFARFKEEALGKRGACVMQAEDAMAAAPLAIANLADVLQEKFGKFNPGDSTDVQQARAEKMRKYIAQRAQYAVIIHEMGHSIALRHNFVSSSDAFNYRSQYWQLRTKNGAIANKPCKDLSTDGEDCVGPRYFDPITENERKNLLWMFMQSSVMDYAGETTQDLIGLGAYDFAAARMFYGDAVAVYQDPTYNIGTARGRGIIEKVDNFGGLLGWDPQIGNTKGTSSSGIDYSQMQDKYQLIKPETCQPVNPADFKPATWDENKYGAFHPVLDALIVSIDGGKTYTKCKQQPVDFVQWNSMRYPDAKKNESGGFYRGGPAIDATGRTRVPYGFATDRWADLGNSAVYRHDNGADLYELFDFWISQQECNHIFDDYRRNRNSFSIRNASNRTLTRYNEKLRDSAKGVALLINIYKDFGLEIGVNDKDIVDYALAQFFPSSALASGIGFDHLARMMARPEVGDHMHLGDDPVLRPRGGYYSVPATQKPEVIIHDGPTGFYGNVAFGGALLENTLATDQGEYDSEYTMNAGSYYGKMWATMLLTESEDNFISDAVTDFNDARYRSISIADVFPEGYRRWLANNLTGDDQIKGVRIAATVKGVPDVNSDLTPKQGIGWTSWWPAAGPEVCFPNTNSIVCSQYGQPSSDPFKPNAVPNTAIVDPLVGWEEQKFLIAWTYVYLPENQKRYWLDRLELKEMGKDADPEWTSRLELHIPDGSTYVARDFGTEVIFGRRVQKGIAGRVVEYANQLMCHAYEGKWYNKFGILANQPATCGDVNEADDDVPPGSWFIADIDNQDNLPIVKFDPNAIPLNANGGGLPNGKPGCSSTPGDDLDCTCEANQSCVKLDKYKTLPWLLSRMDNWVHVGAKGLYPEAL
jgi:hypothetical protein